METKRDKQVIKISAIIATVILAVGVGFLIYFGVHSGDDKITTTTAHSGSVSDVVPESQQLGTEPEEEPDTTVEEAFVKLIKKQEKRMNVTYFRVLGAYQDFHFYSTQVFFEGELENHVLCVFVKDGQASVYYDEKFEKADGEQLQFVNESIAELKSNYSHHEKQATVRAGEKDEILY